MYGTRWSLRKMEKSATLPLFSFEILLFCSPCTFALILVFRVLPPLHLLWCSVWWPWAGGSALPGGPVALLFAFSTSSGWCDLGIRTLREAEQRRGHCPLKDTELYSVDTDRRLSGWVSAYRLTGTVVKAAGSVDVRPCLKAGSCLRWPHNQSISMFSSLRYFYL